MHIHDRAKAIINWIIMVFGGLLSAVGHFEQELRMILLLASIVAAMLQIILGIKKLRHRPHRHELDK